MLTFLTWATAILALLVVLALVYYLTGTAIALTRANRKLSQLADGLEAVERNTDPLTDHVTALDDALEALLANLDQTDEGLSKIIGLVT